METHIDRQTGPFVQQAVTPLATMRSGGGGGRAIRFAQPTDLWLGTCTAPRTTEIHFTAGVRFAHSVAVYEKNVSACAF